MVDGTLRGHRRSLLPPTPSLCLWLTPGPESVEMFLTAFIIEGGK